MEGFCFSPVEKPLGVKLLICLRHHLTPSFISDPMQAITTTWNTQHIQPLVPLSWKYLFFKSFVCRRVVGKTSYITYRRNQNEYTHTHTQTEPSRSSDAPHADGERAAEADGPLLSPLFTFCATMHANCQKEQRFGASIQHNWILHVLPNTYALTQTFLMPHEWCPEAQLLLISNPFMSHTLGLVSTGKSF